LNTWYSNKTIFAICGYININYLENCKKRQQLDALLQTYNLIGTVSFRTCKTNASISAIDSIFITRSKNCSISPHINGLSDHEAQIIVIENTAVTKQRISITTIEDISDQSILEFQLLLSYENWEDIFMEDDANISFNQFLNIYLRIFQSCFIKKHKNSNSVCKPWITKGIENSCNRKRELYPNARDSNELEHKLYSKDIITKSNKMRTTWNIIHK
jgi:hypothetical protein